MSALAKYDRYRKKGYDYVVYKKSLRDAIGAKVPKGYTACMPNNREYSAVLRNGDDDNDNNNKGYVRYDKKDARITKLKREVAKLK